MNILKILCNKCQNNNEKEILLSINTKESRNSTRMKKTKNSYKEVISSNSTSKLEVIDYPYITNSKDNLSIVKKKNLLLHLQLVNHNLESEKSKNKNDNLLDSKSNSSIVMFNEDSYRQNQALLEKMKSNRNDKIIDKINNQKIIENLLYSNKTTEMSNFNVEKILKVNKKTQKKKTVPIKKINQSKNSKKNKFQINKNQKNVTLENNLKIKFKTITNSKINTKINFNKSMSSNNKSSYQNSNLIKDYNQISLKSKTFESTISTNLKKYKSNASRIVKNRNNRLNFSYLVINNNSSKNTFLHKI